jgi:hypothetical protein
MLTLYSIRCDVGIEPRSTFDVGVVLLISMTRGIWMYSAKSALLVCLLGSASQATPLLTPGEDFATAALNLCVAVEIERLDDSVIPAEEIAATVLDECSEEIETVARETAQLDSSEHFRDDAKRRVVELVQSFRGESEL